MHSDELPLCDNIYKSILRDADIIDHLRFGIGTVDSSRLYLRESMIVYRLVLNDMLNPGNDLLQVYAFPLAFGGPCVTESGSKVMMWEFLKWHSELEDQSRIFDLAFSESPDQYVHKLEEVMKRRIGKRTLILGGNHLSVLPCYLALQDMTVLVFDAHRDYLKEESISHASFLRYTNCDQIFIFGYRDKITEEPPSNIYNYVLSEKEKLLSCIEDRKHKNVFIDIDIDVFDPSLITSTNSALPNGLQMDDIWEIVEKVGKDNVLWVSLSEYIPLIDSELDDMRVLQGLIEWIFDLV